MGLRTKRKIEGVKKHMKDYMKIYEQWLADPYFDEDTKNELRAIADDENEIKERFYMDLEFGTAGLRGIIGAGINRMNIYTVRRATQGLANYIKKQENVPGVCHGGSHDPGGQRDQGLQV